MYELASLPLPIRMPDGWETTIANRNRETRVRINPPPPVPEGGYYRALVSYGFVTEFHGSWRAWQGMVPQYYYDWQATREIQETNQPICKIVLNDVPSTASYPTIPTMSDNQFMFCYLDRNLISLVDQDKLTNALV